MYQATRRTATPPVSDLKEWSVGQVLDYVRAKYPETFKDEDLEKLREAKLNGQALLTILDAPGIFQTITGMSVGAAILIYELAKSYESPLAREFTVNSHKRKASDISDYSPKKIRVDEHKDEDDDGMDFEPRLKRKLEDRYGERMINIAEKSRYLKRRNRELVGALGKDSNTPFETSVSKLSDPANMTTLVFPYPMRFTPKPLKVKNGHWAFMGREKFKELLKSLESLRNDESKKVLRVYGTSGYGKSHLLAALVCLLTAYNQKVVYIPDCGLLLESSLVYYVKEVLLFSWTNKKVQERILSFSTEDDIRAFLLEEQPLFVIDQTNELAEIPYGSRDNYQRTYIKRWLTEATHESKCIYGTSANNDDFHGLQANQGCHLVLYLYGGFSTNELEHWWARQKGLKATESEKKNVEGRTGCIPLFLEYCLVDGKGFDVHKPDLVTVSDKASAFTEDLHAKLGTGVDKAHWERYLEYITACISHQPIPDMKDSQHLIDHRFFYDVDGVGHFTCGSAATAVAGALKTLGTPFSAHETLKSIEKFKDNSSVAEFMVELAVLESIAWNGLDISSAFRKKMDMKYFSTEFPRFDDQDVETPVLYVPKAFNYRDIDAVAVLIKPKRKTTGKQPVILCPIQVTISKNYRNSRWKFFDDYQSWVNSLYPYSIEPIFVWIELGATSSHVRSANSKYPKHKEISISLETIDKAVWDAYKLCKGLDSNDDVIKTKKIARSRTAMRAAKSTPATADIVVTAASIPTIPASSKKRHCGSCGGIDHNTPTCRNRAQQR